MATNFIQTGDTITIPAPAAVASGGVVSSGSIIGIAQGDAAIGVPVDVTLIGVHDIAKVAADVVTIGAPIYWDAAEELATVTATDNLRLGTAITAAGNGAATVAVRLVQL